MSPQLQSMVSELKVGFSSALLELSQIQHGDTRLREDMEQTKQRCDQQTLHLQTLVYSLKTELQEVRYQICQLRDDQQQPQKAGGGKVSGSAQTQRNSCVCQACGGTQSDITAPPLSHPGSLLLHCYLQGLQAGQCPGTETPTSCQEPPRLAGSCPFLTTPCDADILQDCSLEGKRQQVALDLIHSEREYLSTLFQLYDKYKILSVLPNNQESCQTFLNYLEQLSQHSLLFRNALEDRLFSKRWQGLLGDVFAKLTCQNDCTFTDMYLGYLRTLPVVLSSFHQSNGVIPTTQGCLGEREELHQVSLLLAPVSRIHSYLAHIQNLLRCTGRSHPDQYLLQVSERGLRHFLCQCHVILEQGDPQGSGGMAGHRLVLSVGHVIVISELRGPCSTGSKGLTASKSKTAIENGEHSEPASATNRDELDKNSHSANGCPALHRSGSRCSHPHSSVWKNCGRDRNPNLSSPLVQPVIGTSCHGNGGFLPAAADPSGGERVSSPGRAPPPGEGARDPGSLEVKGTFEDCDTDLDDLGDASVFDYSSVTSCSPDGTLEMRGRSVAEEGRGDPDEDSYTDEEEEEEEGRQPVQRAVPKEGSVRLGMQVPRVPPHPPPGKPRNQYAGQPTPGPGATKGNEVSASPKTSRPQHSHTRPFRPFEQTTSSRETKMADGTIESPGRRSDNRGVLDRGSLRSGLGVAFYRARRSAPREKGR
ncbi:hypothetical protein AAFF_G00155420 [Aldrovandia affinis]|uniref:DH domain-containing protein n=1 Tax=Aldrovandia affinis TaxID=143900 RepID=A0AAD7T015_9TELE|nr:hypothetical protein AAFF_G00155420 [Aldrovandia affinis]